MAAQTLMIQGTASHVGKSVLTAALCRIFVRRGLRVAPFKAQNMSNNSFVTPDDREIGRAQAVQAAACRLSSRVDFNPVLIKPADACSAQLVVNGVVAGRLSTKDFGRVRREYWGAVQAAFQHLASEFDLVVLEGAGSPAEINLRDHDIVNMAMAREANAPVLLVGDIDRGGVFASLVGTVELLGLDDRRYVKGFVVNKFRGDRDLLTPGLRMLTERTGIDCVGVLPHWGDLRVPEEDSLGWDSWSLDRPLRPDSLTIGIVDLPYPSNFTDVDALAREVDVRLLRLTEPTGRHLDSLIIPGTKNTAVGLRFMKERAIDEQVRRVRHQGGTIIGLCGGYQMLGRRILDPHGVESTEGAYEALGLLDAVTVFEAKKTTVQAFGVHRASGCPIEGYEVHMGRTEGRGVTALLDLRAATESAFRPEGAVSPDGRVMGTYVHGLFDAPRFRRVFLNTLRAARGWPPLEWSANGSHSSLDGDLDRLADFVEEHLDIDAIEAIVENSI